MLKDVCIHYIKVMNVDVRRPAVMGQFYPNSKVELKDNIKECFMHSLGPGKIPPRNTDEEIFGAIVPHAGYMYSGPVAANTYYAISSNIPEIVIILGPNHWGIGRSIALAYQRYWETPLGKIEVDKDAVDKLVNMSIIADVDNLAHEKDHCLEVQLPFLQYIYGEEFKILPIIISNQDQETSNKLGNDLSELAKNRKVQILASSDFTHYESQNNAYMKDSELINAICKLDIEKFYSVLEKNNISACGYGAIASVMITVSKLGAKKGKLLKYATSGDITGDKSSVVGYSSIIFV